MFLIHSSDNRIHVTSFLSKLHPGNIVLKHTLKNFDSFSETDFIFCRSFDSFAVAKIVATAIICRHLTQQHDFRLRKKL